MQYSQSSSVVTHQQPMHLWDYWAVVMKRFLLVAAFVLGSLGLAYFITENQQSLYRATATLKILPPPVSTAESLFMPQIWSDDRFLDTEVDVLKMPATIERAVAREKLSQLPEFHGRSDRDIAQLAIGHVEVSLKKQRLLLDVSVTGPDPEVLPRLANALVSEFREMQRNEGRTRRDEALQQIEVKIESLNRRQGEAERNKKDELSRSSEFQEPIFDIRVKHESERALDWTKKVDAAEQWIAQNRAAYEAIEAALSKTDPAEVENALAQIAQIRERPDVQDADRRIAVAEFEFDQLKRSPEGIGTALPAYRALEQQIERLKADRRQLVEDIAKSTRSEYAGKLAEHADLKKKWAVIAANVDMWVRVKATLDECNDVIKECKDEKAVLYKLREPLVAHLDDRDAVKVIQTASVPIEPYSPNRAANMALGLVAGILGGVALAFLLDYLDDTIRTKDELAKVADVPLLGIVPNIHGRSSDAAKKDLFAHAQPKSTISEAYRGVRTALTLSAQGPMQKVLLLTSAGPREGKTTTAINLATVLAYAGARVLIVDADLRKPRIHKSFGLSNARGLTNLIVGQDDPATVCLPSPVERVDVLPSGPIPPNPSELLGHPRMREVIARLRERYDHVIIDTPPIGAVTDAAVIATIVDGVILVVHAGKTRRQIVMRGIEQLRYINARIVGVILNNLRLGRARYYPGYYHYYYYYASHYGSEDEAPEPARAAPPKGGSSA